MCGSMVDIQSVTAENRRGKKERKKKEETTGVKHNGLPITMGGHKKLSSIVRATYMNCHTVSEFSIA